MPRVFSTQPAHGNVDIPRYQSQGCCPWIQETAELGDTLRTLGLWSLEGSIAIWGRISFYSVPSLTRLGENESGTLRELGRDCNSRTYLCLPVFSSFLGPGPWFWLSWALLRIVCKAQIRPASTHSILGDLQEFTSLVLNPRAAKASPSHRG